MTDYALYLDPSKPDFLWQEWPDTPPKLAYYQLIDLTPEQVIEFDKAQYPQSTYSIAELHPQQWSYLPFTPDRISFMVEKSSFSNLIAVKTKIHEIETDITFEWDHRFHLNYYIKLINYWIYCGVKHFSFYGLKDFNIWQRLQQFLNGEGYFFYDRYHACTNGHKSLYQEHLAASRNLLAFGGWSRWTESGQTRTRGPKEREWTILSPADQKLESLLFAMADRKGVALADLAPDSVIRATESGLAVVKDGHLQPTDKGLWDTLSLVGHLMHD
jgi:hypothetical protein